MDRRRFISTVAYGALAEPLVARPQTATRVRRLGWFGIGAPPSPAERQQQYAALRELGLGRGAEPAHRATLRQRGTAAAHGGRVRATQRRPHRRRWHGRHAGGQERYHYDPDLNVVRWGSGRRRSGREPAPARMGLDQLLLGLLFVLVLFRYRAMIPLMYVLIVAHYIAQEGVAHMKPLVLAGTSGASTPALALTVLSISGLVLSLLGKGYLPRQRSESA